MSREFPKVPVAEVEAAKLMVAHQAAQQAKRFRDNEKFCRDAYPKPGPMRDASLQLADAYAQCAQIWERLSAENQPGI